MKYYLKPAIIFSFSVSQSRHRRTDQRGIIHLYRFIVHVPGTQVRAQIGLHPILKSVVPVVSCSINSDTCGI